MRGLLKIPIIFSSTNTIGIRVLKDARATISYCSGPRTLSLFTRGLGFGSELGLGMIASDSDKVR